MPCPHFEEPNMIKEAVTEHRKEPWCPMDGTEYEGFCVDNFATIRLKGLECDHYGYCLNLKKELEERKNEVKRD